MNRKNIYLTILSLCLCSIFCMVSNSPAFSDTPDEGRKNDADIGLLKDDYYKSLIMSGRIELIEYASATGPIRENTNQDHRLYFNNIYINFEGYLDPRINYIIEFQALTSELYLLGGYVTISDTLEGMDPGEPGSRRSNVKNLVEEHINEIEEYSKSPTFERAYIDFSLHEMFGIRIGKVRNPFGFWDDYSLFRNLSFIKTDPISLGVPLRRTDLGALMYGNLAGKYFSYSAGFLSGEYVFYNMDENNNVDLVAHMGTSFYKLDIGASFYLHDTGAKNGSPHAVGMDFRYLMTRRLTVLGEIVRIENHEYDIETWSAYLQFNYDLSKLITEGLRWNLFLEGYHSDLLKIDLEPDLNYEFEGTYFQASTGLLYKIGGQVDLGIQFIAGIDEEGDEVYKGALKVDARI